MKTVLCIGGHNDMIFHRGKSLFIHVDQGRDDFDPSALLRGGSQYAYTASPRVPRIWAKLGA
jgi:hypothetical protein